MTTNDPWLQKVPPNNVEAEQSILSAILIDNDTLPEVLEVLSEQDFYREVHAKIFRAMVELFERNEPADLVTLTNLLKQQGHLETIGGTSSLGDLSSVLQLLLSYALKTKAIRTIY